MRLEYAKVLPEAVRAMQGLETIIESSTLEPRLHELVRLRASQLNCCAHCVDMHTKDARAIGEDEQRLHLVAVWREAPFFTPRERAALGWTEELTLLPSAGASNASPARISSATIGGAFNWWRHDGEHPERHHRWRAAHALSLPRGPIGESSGDRNRYLR